MVQTVSVYGTWAIICFLPPPYFPNQHGGIIRNQSLLNNTLEM